MPRKNKPNRCADCLTVLCPTTLTSIPTTIATDVRTLAKAWHSKIKVSCPHCGAVHTYRVSEAFVEAAISYARLRGDVAQRAFGRGFFASVVSQSLTFSPILHGFVMVYTSPFCAEIIVFVRVVGFIGLARYVVVH